MAVGHPFPVDALLHRRLRCAVALRRGDLLPVPRTLAGGEPGLDTANPRAADCRGYCIPREHDHDPRCGGRHGLRCRPPPPPPPPPTPPGAPPAAVSCRSRTSA